MNYVSRPSKKRIVALLKSAGPGSVSPLLCLKVQSSVWGFKYAQELGSIPKASANHPTAQHFWKIDSQVTDFSTDNAAEEKLAISFQPSGSLAQT